MRLKRADAPGRSAPDASGLHGSAEQPRALAVAFSDPSGGAASNWTGGGEDPAPSPIRPPVIAGRQMYERGKVIWYKPERGFGFIRRFRGGLDVYVDAAALVAAGIAGPSKGDIVDFVLEKTKDGKPRATSLVLIDRARSTSRDTVPDHGRRL